MAAELPSLFKTNMQQLRSKRSRGVSDKKKKKDRGKRFSMFWPREKWEESKKETRGGGRGGKEMLSPSLLFLCYNSKGFKCMHV